MTISNLNEECKNLCLSPYFCIAAIFDSNRKEEIMRKGLVILIAILLITPLAAQTGFMIRSSDDRKEMPRRNQSKLSSYYTRVDLSNRREVYLSEDFESGMPANWQVIDENNDGYTWTVGTTDDLWLPPINYGTAYAYYSDDDAGEFAPPGNEYLISPSVSCAGISNLVLSYSWAFTIFDPPFGASYARFHDGIGWGGWNQLATYYVDGSGIDTFDLTTHLPADSVQVQFVYEDSTGGWGWAFGIDNVLIETPRDHDVGVASIDIAWHITTDTTFNPRATVKNYGLNSETFDATCEVSPGFYTSTVAVTSLDPGGVQSIIFPDSFTFGSGVYTVTAYTELMGDENPLNDTMVAEVWSTDWQIYDEGSAYGAVAWMDAGNGYGVQFPVTDGWWVDSIACFFDSAWPSPGDTTAIFRLYDGISAPTSLKWELVGATIERGAWNHFAVDTTQSWFAIGNNCYFFYVQVQPYPNCPGLSFDYVVNYPQYMWQYASGYFNQATTDGDFLMRIHTVNSVGINEWISLTPDDFLLDVPAIARNKIPFAFSLPTTTEIELVIYDVLGRRCKTLVCGTFQAGAYHKEFDITLAAGVYFYNIRTESGLDVTGKVLIVK
jgi:hypothetical protein